MSDTGDYWREAREHKRKQRASWVECERCLMQAFHNPRMQNFPKVPPGGKCHRCGWEAPKADK